MIFTVGYQLRKPEELIAHLENAKVDVVIDVRETPWSYVPAYREAALRSKLASHDIRYVHAPFAGNPRRFRREATSHEECLSLYREHLEDSPEVVGRFATLVNKLQDQGLTICLLCYERHPSDCHRHILVESLRIGNQVAHLATGGAPRFITG